MSEGQELFADGVRAEDIGALQPLLAARGLLRAFVTLFRGSEDEVLARLLVLREIGVRAEAPRWSPQDLRAHFAYIDPVKLETVLKRLRDNDLLLWDNDEAVYALSAPGRVALAALTTILEFATEADAELGYFTAQVAAGQALGRLSGDALQHLLARLNELQNEFEQAVLSGSEFRIRASQQRLDAVWRWVEKGTEIIRAITAEEDLDTHTYRVAQQIGHAQSRMLRMTAVFQRALNGIEAQRVHLGASGLHSSDIADWLRGRSVANLLSMLKGAVSAHPEPAFVTASEMLDIAEFELLERERALLPHTALPPGQAAPESLPDAPERLLAAERFLDDLRLVEQESTLEQVVVIAHDYALSAYRLSLLALLNDPESAALAGTVADLARQALSVEFTDQLTPVMRGEVAAISTGVLRPRR